MMCPPRPCSLCGVKPMWPITGMPACTIRLICLALRSPPSSLTAWQPVSFMNRIAEASASSGPFSYEPNGRSAIDERPADPVRHSPGERDQLVDRDGHRGVVPEDRIAGRVADEQEVDARLVEDLGRQRVVAGESGDLDPVLLGPLEMADADSLEGRIAGAAPVGSRSSFAHDPTVPGSMWCMATAGCHDGQPCSTPRSSGRCTRTSPSAPRSPPCPRSRSPRPTTRSTAPMTGDQHLLAADAGRSPTASRAATPASPTRPRHAVLDRPDDDGDPSGDRQPLLPLGTGAATGVRRPDAATTTTGARAEGLRTEGRPVPRQGVARASPPPPRTDRSSSTSAARSCAVADPASPVTPTRSPAHPTRPRSPTSSASCPTWDLRRLPATDVGRRRRQDRPAARPRRPRRAPGAADVQPGRRAPRRHD